MIFNIKRSVFGSHSYSFSGTKEFASQGLDFELALDSSGTLVLDVGIPLADICVVAGGAKGSTGDLGGGAGGRGGEVVTETSVTLPAGTYDVTVGGSGANSVLLSPDGRVWTARSGYGKGQSNRAGVQGDWAWNDEHTLLREGYRYGAGGGYGSYVNDSAYQHTGNEGAGGSVGDASDDPNNGRGGTSNHGMGYAGFASTGQGGGGGRYHFNDGGYQGGAGGRGVILIRKHKEA